MTPAVVASTLRGSPTCWVPPCRRCSPGGPTGGPDHRPRRTGRGCRYTGFRSLSRPRERFTVNDEGNGQQYRFMLPGPNLTAAEQTQCLDALRKAARSAEFVVASRSLPPGVPADFYRRVADICRELGVLLVLDTSGGGLQHITSGVFVLKPSVRELRECFGRELATESEQLAAATSSSDPVSPKPLWCGSAQRAHCWPHRMRAEGFRLCQCMLSAVSVPTTQWCRPSWSD